MSLNTWEQPFKATDSGQKRWRKECSRVETSVKGDRWQKDSGKSEKEGLQDVSDLLWWFGDTK